MSGTAPAPAPAPSTGNDNDEGDRKMPAVDTTNNTPATVDSTTTVSAPAATAYAAPPAAAKPAPPAPTTTDPPPKKRKTPEEIKAEARAYALSSTTKKRIPLWQQQQQHWKHAHLQNIAAASARLPPPGLSSTLKQMQQEQVHVDLLKSNPQYRKTFQQQQQQQVQQAKGTAKPPPSARPPPAVAAAVNDKSGVPEPVSHAEVLSRLKGAKVTSIPASTLAAASTAAAAAAASAAAGPPPEVAILHPQPPPPHYGPLPPSVPAVPPPTPPPTIDAILNDKNLDDYTRFVKALAIEDSWKIFQGDDEEEDYQLDPKEEEDDDGDDDDEEEDEDDDDNEDDEQQADSSRKRQKVSHHTSVAAPTESSTLPVPGTPTLVNSTATSSSEAQTPMEQDSDNVEASSPTFSLPDWDAAIYEELEQELGWLEEEDMEAAVATLLDNHPRKKTASDEYDNNNNNSHRDSDNANLPIPFPTIISNNTQKSSNTNSNSNELIMTVPEKQAAAAIGNVVTKAGSTTPQFNKTAPGTPAAEANATSASSSNPHPATFTPSEIMSPSKASATDATGAAARNSGAPGEVTKAQYDQLKDLMHKHYQLLMQQAVLAVRAAHYQKYHRSRSDRTDFMTGGETADDMVEILDGAVGMLQDLDQNHKDAIRHYIQFHNHAGGIANTSKRAKLSSTAQSTQNACIPYASPPSGTQRSLFSNDDNQNDDNNIDLSDALGDSKQAERRLTRAQFNKSLQEQNNQARRQVESVFDIQGLGNLSDTFATIDKSVQSEATTAATEQDVGDKQEEHLLEIDSTEKACLLVLDKAKVKYDKRLVPGARDVSKNFVDPREFLGPHFVPPCTREEETLFRRNRNLFTSGEDNLVLRGVNLYGEKQWMLIADRFIPDRSINIISQRYSKLCLMLYKANGVKIDSDGNLEPPPKYECFEDIPVPNQRKLKPVGPPTVFNVHRWSLEEDLTLLKAVPRMGHMWAELGMRLIPHRDRGHLRKRYQVLERRVKATVTRAKKQEQLKAIRVAVRGAASKKSSSGATSESAAPTTAAATNTNSEPQKAKASSGVTTATRAAAKAKPTRPARIPAPPPPPPPTTTHAYSPQARAPPAHALLRSPQTTHAPVHSSPPTLAYAHSPPTTYAHPQPPHPYPQAHAHAYPPSSPPPPPPPHAYPMQPHAPYAYHPHYMYHHPAHYPHPHLYSPGYHAPPPPYSPGHHVPYPPHPYPHHVAPPPPQTSPRSVPAAAPVAGPAPTTVQHGSAPTRMADKEDPESGSRVAFERLAQESQWSQMTRMREMMANDTETMVASALATDLARAPAKVSDTSKQQHQSKQQEQSPSKKVQKGASLEDVTDSTSFLAGVLERVEQAELSRGGSNMALGLGNDGKHTTKRTPSKGDSSAPNAMETPSKRVKAGDFPATPKGLTPPALQSSPPSAVSISSLAQGSSHRIFAGSSPAYPLPPNPSPDGAVAGSRSSNHGFTPEKSLFGANGTLMENDLEAISALNLLGNSPALLDGSGSKSGSGAGSGTGNTPKKSLFAKVVGGTKTSPAPAPLPGAAAQKQSKKRKLKF